MQTAQNGYELTTVSQTDRITPAACARGGRGSAEEVGVVLEVHRGVEEEVAVLGTKPGRRHLGHGAVVKLVPPLVEGLATRIGHNIG